MTRFVWLAKTPSGNSVIAFDDRYLQNGNIVTNEIVLDANYTCKMVRPQQMVVS